MYGQDWDQKTFTVEWSSGVYVIVKFGAGWYLYVSNFLQNLAIGCQMWRVRNLGSASQLTGWANIEVDGLFNTNNLWIVFNNSAEEEHMVHKRKFEHTRTSARIPQGQIIGLFRPNCCYSSHHLPIAFWRLKSLFCLQNMAGIMMAMVVTRRSLNLGFLRNANSVSTICMFGSPWPI